MLHQIHNTTGNVYNAFMYRHTDYSVHFHKAFEFIMPIKGEMRATVNQMEYCLKVGECLLIPSYAMHSLSVADGNDCIVVVFSERYAESAAKQFQDNESEGYRLRLSPEERTYVIGTLAGECEKEMRDGAIALKKPSIYRLKACLYMIFDAFVSQNSMHRKSADGELVARLIDHVEREYATDLTLTALAQRLGYSYDYLSRVFNHTFHVNFKTIVNQYRCERAMHLLQTTQRSLTDIASESGFQSIRSFNRVFRELIGCAPSDLRRGEE